jgi:hypothetical protein
METPVWGRLQRAVTRLMHLERNKDKDSPVNGTSAPVFRLMSDS